MIKKSLFLAIIIFLIFTMPVLAQENNPSSQFQELLAQFGVYLATVVVAFMGMVSTRLTAWIRDLKWFTDKEKSTIAGIVADLVSGLSSLVVTLIAIGIAYVTKVLESPETQTVVWGALSTWLAAYGLHKVNKVVKKAG